MDEAQVVDTPGVALVTPRRIMAKYVEEGRRVRAYMRDLTPLVPFACLVAATYYVLARAEITRWIWSRYPAWLDRMALCPICMGFHLGWLASLILPVPVIGPAWTFPLWGGVYGMTLGPLVFAGMRAWRFLDTGAEGLERLAGAIETASPDNITTKAETTHG